MKTSEIILNTTPQGNVKVEVPVREYPVWLTPKIMFELFLTAKHNIRRK